ncbi:hypothetical protein [Wolbachia endosymbiont of Dactylopius coccus]
MTASSQRPYDVIPVPRLLGSRKLNSTSSKCTIRTRFQCQALESRQTLRHTAAVSLRCTVPECDGMIKCKKKIPSKEELWLHGCARTTA